MSSTIIKNDKKVIRAWAVFDWANSVYPLVISTAVFPIYFASVLPEKVDIMNVSYSSSSLYTFSVTLAYILIACLSPLLSGIADSSGKRLFFLRLFSTIGAFACAGLFFFGGSEDLWQGVSFFLIATIGFAGSIVFYDSFLPLIATKDQYDRISARGYTYGYIGSVICLVVILAMIQMPEFFGMEPGTTLPSRIGFVLVGAWWLVFSQYTFVNMPKDKDTKITKSMLSQGYEEVSKVFKRAVKMPNILSYLLSFFFVNAGVQTVIYLASLFAKKEIGMETGELILTILLIQLVGIVGAILFSRVSKSLGNRNALIIQMAIWAFLCCMAYLCANKYQFYAIACGVGMVMGGIQALARSSYSKLIPADTEDVTSFFSLYDVTFKASVVFGTFLYGLVDHITNSMRLSALVLGLCFVLAIIFQWGVKYQRDTTV